MDNTGTNTAVGSFANSFVDSYLRTKAMKQNQQRLDMDQNAQAMNQQVQTAGLLNQGYKIDSDTNQLSPTEEKQNELAVKAQQAQIQKDSFDPDTEISKSKREFAKKMAAAIQPGSEDMIPDTATGYEIDNNYLPQMKSLTEAQLNSKLKGVDYANKVKENQKPDEGAAAAATAYSQARQAHDTVTKLEQGGFDPTSSGVAAQGLLKNKFAQTPEFKQNQAAENQFIGAYTAWRKQRGENPESAEVLKDRFFPQPGEDKGTADIKSQAREAFLDSLKQQSGTYAQSPKSSGLLGKSKKPPGGHMSVIQNGHTYNWNAQKGTYE